MGAIPAFVPPVWQQPGFFARIRFAMQPRLLMTAAMAFFSIAVTLNITGFSLPNVHVTPLRLADLRPRAMRAYMERQITMASVPIMRYYDHLRFVYELESQVRELRGETEGEQQRNEAQPQKPGETRRVPVGKSDDLLASPGQYTDRSVLGPDINRGNDLLQSSLQLSFRTGVRDRAAQHPSGRGTTWTA